MGNMPAKLIGKIKEATLNKNGKLDQYVIQTLKKSVIAIMEKNYKDGGTLVEKLESSKNLGITIERIKQNALLGGVFDQDYYLVDFKGSVAEIKTAQFLTQRAMKFSVIEIKNIRYDILFQGDNFKIDNNGYEITPNFEVDNTKYENVIGGLAMVEFFNGSIVTVRMSKNEFEAAKKLSPSKTKDGKVVGPWATFPIQMCEVRLIKKLMKRIPVDNVKINSVGYTDVPDDVALKAIEVDGEIKATPDYEFDGSEVKEIDPVQFAIDECKNNPEFREMLVNDYHVDLPMLKEQLEMLKDNGQLDEILKKIN